MPDPDKLMEVWPADFEQALKDIPLPSPDLDLSLVEYSKVTLKQVLCLRKICIIRRCGLGL